MVDFFFDAKTIEPKQADPWWQPQPMQAPDRPDYADNEEMKKAFGVALAKGLEPFQAGLQIFNQETSKALWISVHWLFDPVALAAKDAYAKALKSLEKPLDREQFLAEVLSAARHCEDDRDRATFFKLYAETAGFIGKVADTVNNTVNNTQNVMTVKFVRPSERTETIEAPSNTQSKIQNDVPDLPRLKLVNGAR